MGPITIKDPLCKDGNLCRPFFEQGLGVVFFYPPPSARVDSANILCLPGQGLALPDVLPFVPPSGTVVVHPPRPSLGFCPLPDFNRPKIFLLHGFLDCRFWYPATAPRLRPPSTSQAQPIFLKEVSRPPPRYYSFLSRYME